MPQLSGSTATVYAPVGEYGVHAIVAGQQQVHRDCVRSVALIKDACGDAQLLCFVEERNPPSGADLFFILS